MPKEEQKKTEPREMGEKRVPFWRRALQGIGKFFSGLFQSIASPFKKSPDAVSRGNAAKQAVQKNSPENEMKKEKEEPRKEEPKKEGRKFPEEDIRRVFGDGKKKEEPKKEEKKKNVTIQVMPGRKATMRMLGNHGLQLGRFSKEMAEAAKRDPRIKEAFFERIKRTYHAQRQDPVKEEANLPKWQDELANHKEQFVAALLLSNGQEREQLFNAMLGKAKGDDKDINRALSDAYVKVNNAKNGGKLDTSLMGYSMEWLNDRLAEQKKLDKDTTAMSEIARVGLKLMDQDEKQKEWNSWTKENPEIVDSLKGHIAMTDVKTRSDSRHAWLKDPMNAGRQLKPEEICQSGREMLMGKVAESVYDKPQIRDKMAGILAEPRGLKAVDRRLNMQITHVGLDRKNMSGADLEKTFNDDKQIKEIYENMENAAKGFTEENVNEKSNEHTQTMDHDEPVLKSDDMEMMNAM